MPLSNDGRGWAMTVLSGIACVVGASVICVDLIIRRLPGKKNFRIQDSDAFLSASLSLSFGVMLFSSLYSMLPSARRSLQNGGYSPKEAAWIMIICFLGGVAGIQIISRYLHHLTPSHVVDCGHTHDEEAQIPDIHSHSHHDHEHADHEEHSHKAVAQTPIPEMSEHEPQSPSQPESNTTDQHLHIPSSSPSKRPSLKQLFTSSISTLIPKKELHEECDNPCFGFTEPCGQQCFKNINKSTSATKDSTQNLAIPTESTPLLSQAPTTAAMHSHGSLSHAVPQPSSASSTTLLTDTELGLHKSQVNHSHGPDHHHHVPTNAFLSIGLQTSIAIALHKLPEGFITFATNHANPKLGVAVFLALFIHNITEGFALALPLYLALNSRVKAMVISFVLGGLSQPLGALVAALWFMIAGQGDWAPSEGIYGGMFAVTAGIMTSVALSLFSESLELTHSRTLCMVGAFTGMGILGISSALTA
ncbi:Zinc/iron permease [Acrodontium crateriforme]|uniref:Zinc/iron permease n=1 Tax=Acrodontium crateriforme TaxID=150365 RepID=A0AAQ3MCY2_9PEZI|nr:Zinc/iron permease [Acrodontium crateriforme]